MPHTRAKTASKKATRSKAIAKKAPTPRLKVRLRTSTLVLLLAGLFGVAFSGLNFYTKAFAEPIEEQSIFFAAPLEIQPTVSAPTLPQSAPRVLRIPKIGMKRSLVEVGLKKNGSLEVPDSYSIGGWYSGAPTPGELGPAVLVGHVDSPKGYTIFWQLNKLQPGDKIEVDRADGSTAVFKVDEIRRYPQNNFPGQEVYGNISYAGIRVITCGGVFNHKTQHYSENTVVYGSLVTE